ncbi:MAG: DUF1015 domain-containing protein [Oscillospiraceae bacterium]|nr:DUF1015 domain-containing protein [Oscillospiraceae bacterium]
MAKVIPFKGLRYNLDKIGDLAAVTAPPYDIIPPAKQDELYAQNEYNVIRLEYGKEQDGDNESNNKYTRANEFLQNWISNDILKFEAKPAFYIYEQVFSLQPGVMKSFKGIISNVEVADFSENVVLPHEQTLSKAKSDRFDLMTATDANFSQIYSLYTDESGGLRAIINEQSEREPDVSFTSDEGILQNVWIITDESVNASITKLFADKQLFIADGHHRYETAINYRNKKREENPNYTGDEPFNYVMMMLVDMDDEGLVVFPTHRLIKDLPNFDEVNLVSMLTDNFNVSKIYVTDSDIAGVISEKMGKTLDEKMFSLYTGKNYYYLLELKDINIMDELFPSMPKELRHLDVTVLHSLILEQLLGIDKENMAAQKNLTYTRSLDEAITEVQAKKFQCSFIINSTKISEIKDVCLIGKRMPQKSTYFWPKLVTGIVISKF